MRSVLIFHALLIVPSLALRYDEPMPTDFSKDGYDYQGISPIPTGYPNSRELLRRGANPHIKPRQVATQTCGYLFGELEYPYDCGSTAACAYNTRYGIFGCCSTDDNGLFQTDYCPNVVNPYTSCYPYSERTLCTGACFSANRVCSSAVRADEASPDCGTYVLRDVSTTMRAYFCNSLFENAVVTVLPTGTPGTSSTTTPTPNTSTIRSTTSTSTSFGGSTTTSAPPTSSTPPTPPPPPSPTHSNTGAIAGGVVGGILVIAIIAGGIIYKLHRKKVAQRQQAGLEVSQVPY